MAVPAQTVEVAGWEGRWADDDPDANLKADIASHAHLDPLSTIAGLAAAVGVPEGALVHYVLAKWATAGSGGLLELGPAMVNRLWAPVEAAERIATDAARLDAYRQLRDMLSWLRHPLAEGQTPGC